MFGSPQSTTAQQINVSETLPVAANTSGGRNRQDDLPVIYRRGLRRDGHGGPKNRGIPLHRGSTV
ncbi:hypothetical protein ACNKHL_18205 [Shigella flexneri]